MMKALYRECDSPMICEDGKTIVKASNSSKVFSKSMQLKDIAQKYDRPTIDSAELMAFTANVMNEQVVKVKNICFERT